MFYVHGANVDGTDLNIGMSLNPESSSQTNLGVNTTDPTITDPDGWLDGFTNGIADPNRILFTITPTDHHLYWRFEVYDTYLSTKWDKDIETSSYSAPVQ